MLLSFVVPRKWTNTNFSSSSSFEIVCSFVFIVCSSSKTNEDLFFFENLQTIKSQLQTISKLDLGVKWLNLNFWRTTNEKSWTTNNYKRFQSSILKVNGFSFVLEVLQTMKAQLQTISKLELQENRVLVRFRGTTNHKNTTTNDFEARSWVKWLNLNFWRATNEKK